MSSKSAKIYIIEDEALIADHIAMCLEEEGYPVCGIADNGETALTEIQATQPDLCLLDINLNGDLDGIDIAHELNKLEVPFIYVTSNTNSRTLARVKRTEPAGFIVKPYTAEDLSSNILIALYKQERTTPPPPTAEKSEVEDSFFVKEKHELIRVRYDAVLFAEAMDNYTSLHTEKGKFVLSQTLKNVEGRLKDYGFLRVHRSYIVNLKCIDLIAPKHLLIGAIEIPVSESQRQNLLDRIQLF